MTALVLFLPAGRIDWWRGWIFIGMWVVIGFFSYLLVKRRNPRLIDDRKQWIKPDTKDFDKVFIYLFMTLLLLTLIIAGLDERFGWTHLPPGLIPIGIALSGVSAWLSVWSMLHNPFFEASVRIQREKGHYVVDTGPYRFVRHPSYAGIAAWFAGACLILGSAAALIPSLAVMALLVYRTAMEDRTLKTELEGYREYAERVRFRLIPGVW